MPARVVQVSDTHFDAGVGPTPVWRAVREWLIASPPDLIVHTGDIVHHDPDDEDDLRLARAELSGLPAPVVVVPGNHDVGFFDEGPDRPRRLDRFRAAWGDDTFARDLAGWRLVGADAYRLGDADHDAWLADAVAGSAPVAVFVHQPVWGERPDSEWRMPAAAVAAFERAVAGADVRVIATGHWHLGAVAVADGRRHVWCPSTEYLGDPGATPPGGEGMHLDLGVLEHRFDDDGGHAAGVVEPWS